MDSATLIPWSDLPKELVERIGWLVKFMQTVDGKFWIVNPLCHKKIHVSLEDVTYNELNLLDFRITQVCKSSLVQYFDRLRPYFQEKHSLLGEHRDANHLLRKVRFFA
ncbi:hypothetical protein P3L10_006279 [Capsicum annuum]